MEMEMDMEIIYAERSVKFRINIIYERREKRILWIEFNTKKVPLFLYLNKRTNIMESIWWSYDKFYSKVYLSL